VASEPGEQDSCFITFSPDGATLHVCWLRDGIFREWNSTVYVAPGYVEAIHAELAAKGISTLADAVAWYIYTSA
jgi:hypothetical protein